MPRHHGDGVLVLGAHIGHVHGLGACGLQLRARFGHFRPVGRAAPVAVFGEFERLPVGRNRVFQNALFLIQAAQIEIVQGQLGMETQARIFQVRGRGLSAFDGGRHQVANSAPQIGFPGRFKPQVEIAGNGFGPGRGDGRIRR